MVLKLMIILIILVMAFTGYKTVRYINDGVTDDNLHWFLISILSFGTFAFMPWVIRFMEL